MYVQKDFSFRGIMAFSGGHLVWLTLWAGAVALLYEFTQWHWISIPWLPLSVIGTAVAFYIGFKNNQAYDRLWEARKIWGAIVNSSRSWGASVSGFVSNLHNDNPTEQKELDQIIKTLIYRHIAWLYAFRSQLLIPTTWEHINQNKHIARTTQQRRKYFGLGLLGSDDHTSNAMTEFLKDDERQSLLKAKNTATQIIHAQAQQLKQLRERKLIDDFRHTDLQKQLNDFYTHQGKAERIKKFPLPRQYGSMSMIFVGLFIFLLPFGMISEFHKLGDWGIWLAIPFTVLVSWVYLMMELIGDYSENPFEGLGNDIPMLSLCRTIEIDLKEMLGETDLPNPIEPVRGVLM